MGIEDRPVPHVEDRRHVGRVDDDHDGFTRASPLGAGREHTVLGPLWVPGGLGGRGVVGRGQFGVCPLYTSPSPRDSGESRMPSSA